MNKFLSVFFLNLFATVSIVLAQENFQPGYMISYTGDTLKGFIDYRNWVINPDQIAFKKTPVSEASVHLVEEIKGFSVNNETYEKATVQHDINPTRTEDLTYSPVPKYEKRTFLLMVLYRGQKSLYFLRDRDKRVSLYIKNEAGEFVLLVRYRYRVEGGNVITSSMYKDQLGAYLNDCQAAARKIKLLTYSEISVGKLFKEYYTRCSQLEAVSVTVPEKPGFEFGVTAGATVTTLKFRGDTDLDRLKFDPSLRPAAGIYLNVTVPRNNRRLSIYNELILSNYSLASYSLTPVIGGAQTRTDRTIGMSYIKLTNLLRYQFSAGKVKFFVNGGISNGLAVSETNKERLENITSSGSIVHENKFLSRTRKYEQGWVVGVGGRAGKISLELRREASNGMSAFGDLNSSVTRYFLLLGYQFH
ncbi:hypothetical protein DYBT9275_02845 [Dyadobacter sp. CECT 9275]|uniref:Outer membrane protein beta-barrel domain-containing protein n=1 Tax=Dyadobacter helix TaxID=2822344 RepID=A0A916JCC8_9BACT|nr:outer membrane beta-barrel protein [Dyadobacter sp. CECT 9275]CAG5002232.1 hypothetical protein DYBT9275_02845 [Dyadobacter sp. CECT 9275]